MSSAASPAGRRPPMTATQKILARACGRDHVVPGEVIYPNPELVIIHDYNRERSLLTSIAEWMEGGDYFRFIKIAEKEMADCTTESRIPVTTENKHCFSHVQVLRVGPRAAWYLCTPNK